MKVAFLTEPVPSMDRSKNNNLKLIEEGCQRGHEIYQFESGDLSLDGKTVYAKVKRISVNLSKKNDFCITGEEEGVDLSKFDVVFIREEPPMDMQYITATYILERLPESVLVINRPESIRNYPEKILPEELSEFTPATLFSCDIEAIKGFANRFEEVIIKPLYLFGGTGVYKFEVGSPYLERRARQMIEEQRSPIIVQQFLPDVSKGDKRILLIDGEVEGAFLRVPSEGNVRANLMQGGTAVKTEITDREQKICDILGPILRSEGVMICGIDVIGGYLTEINNTCPIGFREIETLYGTKPTKKLWEKVERFC